MTLKELLICYVTFLTLTNSDIEIDYQERGCLTNLKQQYLNASFIFAGLFPNHLLQSFNSSTEFRINYAGIAWSAAMVFAVREINNQEDLLPGVTLGYDIRDSCNEPDIGVMYSLDFLLDPKYQMSELKSANNADRQNNRKSVGSIVGLIGCATSSMSAIVGSMLGAYFLPLISYSSTSPSLSDTELYPSFLRTVPSDVYQADAIAELLSYFGWKYVSAFASDDEYGRLGLDELRYQLKKRAICLAADDMFLPSFSSRNVAHIVKHLKQLKNIPHVVILWCQRPVALALIEEVEKNGLLNITWVGTETWGTSFELKKIVQGNHIGLKLAEPIMQKFLNIFYTSDINCENPWFKLLIKKILPGFSCDQAVKLNVARLVPVQKYTHVIAAVYAMAHGLHDFLGCTNQSCSLPRKQIDYEQLYHRITRVNFTVPGSNYHVMFDKNGESILTSYDFVFYNKYHFSDFVTFGSWDGKGTLKIQDNLTRWQQAGKPFSYCSQNCVPGFYRVNGSDCCWSCVPCSKNLISSQINADKCYPCANQEITNTNQSYCLKLSEKRLTVNSQYGFIIMPFSCVGVASTIFVLLVFLKHWNTPLVRASSRELSCIQLISLLLLFCLPVLYFIQSTVSICILRTMIFGFLFTTVVAIISIKTYRLRCVFFNKVLKLSKYLHNRYQIGFCYLIVTIQLLATAVWHGNFPPDIVSVYDRDGQTYFRTCGRKEQVIFLLIIVYVFVLALTSAYMAFRARKLPENFNETQFIFYSMFTTCIIWLMFIPLYVSLNSVPQTTAFLLVNFVSSMCLLCFLFGNKVRIILFHPELNSREHYRKISSPGIHLHRLADKQYHSVPMFEMTTRRRHTFTSVDNLSSTPNNGIEHSGKSVTRRASFGGLGKEEFFQMHNINLEFLKASCLNKNKSLSTPMMLDSPLTSKPTPYARSVSYCLDKVRTATSLNLLFSSRSDEKDSCNPLLEHTVAM